MLDVERGADVDAGGEQLLDVQVALGVAAAGRVGVGELVDQHQLRAGAPGSRRGPSPRARGPGSRSRRRGITSRPVEQRLRSRRGRGSRPRRPRRRRPRAGAPAPTAASRRSCRRPGAAPRKIFSRPRRLAAAPPRAGRRARAACRGVVGRPSGMPMPRSALLRPRLVEGEVERQHVDARLAEQAERPALGVGGDQRADARPRAGRGPWPRAAPGRAAAAGEMSGSRPLAEVVTRSTGTGAAGFSALQPRRRRRVTRSTSAFAGRAEVGAAGVGGVVGAGTVLPASFGSVPVVAEGRPWK